MIELKQLDKQIEQEMPDEIQTIRRFYFSLPSRKRILLERIPQLSSTKEVIDEKGHGN